MIIEELVKAVLSELKETTRTETVVGKPLKLEETTIIPVSKISIGFGTGGAKGEKGKQGEGTGGGVSVEPVAFIVVRGEKVDLIAIRKEDIGLKKLIDLVPQAAEKIREYKKKKSETSEKKGGKRT